MYTHQSYRFHPEVGLALAFGAMTFVVLLVVTGGLMVSLVFAVCGVALLTAAHYALWGRDFSRQTAAAHRAAATQRLDVPPVPAGTLPLDDAERRVLYEVIEDALVTPSARGPEELQTLRQLLDRLRNT